jgi:hypothetical protein
MHKRSVKGKKPTDLSEEERDYLERRYPRLETWFLEILLVLPKKDVMLDLELTKQAKRFI